MKKVLFSLVTAVFLVSGFSIQVGKAETPVLDAGCLSTGDYTYELVGQNAPDEQTFDPIHNRLTQISFMFGGNVAGNKSIDLSLRTESDSILSSTVIMPTITEKGYRTWTFSEPITVTPYDTYRIRVENNYSATLYWYTNGSGTCYTRGNARQNSTDMGFDFGFSVYGYTYTEPTPTPTPTQGSQTTTATPVSQTATPLSNTSLNSDASAGTGAAPATTTSTSLSEPSALQIEQISVDGKPVLKINWTASKTTDIDGYKIFRAEGDKGTFKNTTKVTSKTLEFKDAEIEVGKTYRYQVRAYKGTEESKSSNTVSKAVEEVTVVSATPTATQAPIATEPADKSSKAIYYLIAAILLIVAAGLLLYRFKKWPFKKAKTIK